jgi:serine/threonine protein kinase
MANTLAQRLGDGLMAVPESLRVSMLLAEALRKIHDDGRAHGALCPGNVEVGESGVTLAAGPADVAYLAPEVIAGREPDARSDIFSFGAMVFEMFTGRRAFEGDVRQDPPSTGSPAVDRLVLPCLAMHREARVARMQRVILELKVLRVAARRAAAASAAKNMQARLVERLEVQERATAEMQRSAGEAVAILRGQVSAMRERAKTEPTEAGAALSDRVAAMEHALDLMKQHAYEFEHSVAADLVDIEESLRLQTVATDSVRQQLSQTDDVVERMVKAFEALQRAVLDRDGSEDSTIAVN